MRAFVVGEKKSKLYAVVGFEQFIIVASFWRIPGMIPDELKRMRIKRVGEVELMAHALTISRCIGLFTPCTRSLPARRFSTRMLPRVYVV